MSSLRIDVIIATYNRCGLLELTLDSLLKAHIPSDLDVTVIVVDNNSTDDTRRLVQSYEPKFQGRLKYIFEQRHGEIQRAEYGHRRNQRRPGRND